MHDGLAIPRVSRHSVGFSLKGLTHQQSLLLRGNICVQALPPDQESRTLSKEALTCPSRPLERCSAPGFILLPAPPLLQHPGPFSFLPSNKHMQPCKAEGEETVVPVEPASPRCYSSGIWIVCTLIRRLLRYLCRVSVHSFSLMKHQISFTNNSCVT